MNLVAIAQPLQVDLKDFNDAVERLSLLEGDVQGLFKSIREQQRDLVIKRFRQGSIIQALIELEGATTSTIERLEDSTGISRTVLFDARKFYLHEQWHGSEAELIRWMEDEDKVVHWGRIRSIMRNNYAPGEPGFIEQETDRLVHDAEIFERKIERFETTIEEEALGPQYIEAKGVAVKAREILSDLKGRIDTLQVRVEPPRVPAYLQWIREQPCCVSGSKDKVVAHHAFTHGQATKCSDLATVPLHDELHKEFHRIGRDSFAEKYNYDPWREVANYLHLFMTGQKI